MRLSVEFVHNGEFLPEPAAHTEMVTLGAVAVQLGRKITRDAANLRIPGEPAAAALLHPTYRPGFTIA